MSSIFLGLRRFGIVAICCCVAFGLSTAAHAQTFTISNASAGLPGNASYPNIVTDANGNLNLVWIDSVKGIMFARTSSSGGTTALGTVVPIPGSNGQALPAFQPQVAVYSDPTAVNIAWAAVHPGSTSTPPTYDIWVARSDDSGQHFTLASAGPISLPASPTGVVLADGPRLAFDQTGKINVVWGEHEAWISWSQDGMTFSPPINLAAPNSTFDTGGPRIAVDNLGFIFVAWTDELAEKQGTPNTYCTTFPPATDGTGHYTATSGGHLWMNETPPPKEAGGDYGFSSGNTRDLASTDWAGVNGPQWGNAEWPNGFYGCSFDNLNLFQAGDGYMHLVWSDDQPDEDVLTSHSGNRQSPTPFTFPVNLASVPAASPKAAADNSGNIYVVWSGGPGGGTGKPTGTNSQGIFFSRIDTVNGTYSSPAINIADPNAVAPAYPQIIVDCPTARATSCQSGGVNVAWEQVDQPQVASTGTFDVFFAHSSDKGNTFKTSLQVSKNSSALCFTPTNPIQTTPDNTTCGTVQLGMDAAGNPDMAWVNQATGASTTNLDLAITNLAAALPSDFSISANPVTQTAQPAQTVNFSVSAAALSGFSGSINLGCENFAAVTEGSSQGPGISALSSLTCTPITPSSINAGQTSTVSVTVPSGILANGATSAQMTFVITGTSASAPEITHRIPVTITVGTNSPASITPASASLTASQPSVQFTVKVNPADFAGKVQFSCLDADTGSTPPSWLDCSSFTPNPLDLSTGGTSAMWTVTRKSAPPATSMLISAPPSQVWPAYGGSAAWTMVLLGICLISSTFVLGRRQGASNAVLMRGCAVMTLTIVLAVGLVSCGGSTSTPTTTNSSGTSGSGGTGGSGGSGGSGSGGSGGTGGTGGSGGSGGTGGGSTVTVHLEVLAQSSNATPMVLGTVTINAQ